ncbi:hypothetical protein D3C86_2080590 [compost metagenome]
MISGVIAAVRWGAWLLPPRILEACAVDRIEANVIDELHHESFLTDIVARDGDT